MKAPPRPATGYFWDGRYSRRRDASLAYEGGKFRLELADGEVREYPRREVAVGDRIARVPRAVGFRDGARFETDEHRVVDAWKAGTPAGFVARLEAQWQLVTCAAFGLLFSLVLAYLFVLPGISARLAQRVPDWMIAGISAESVEWILTHGGASSLTLEEEAHAGRVYARVAESFPELHLQFWTISSDRFGTNAMAMPDGTVFVTDELIKELTDDELEGVLLHEVGHVALRHAISGGIENSALTFAQLILGGGRGASFSVELLDAAFSRKQESQADAFAQERLAERGLPIDALRSALTKITRNEKVAAAERDAGFLRQHPITEERVKTLEKLAGTSTPEALAASSWRDCEAGTWKSCKRLASYQERGFGMARNPAAALGLAERACRANEVDGCEALGAFLERGIGRDGDATELAGVWGKACGLGAAHACGRVGVWELGRGGEARSFLEKGCEGRDAVSCFRLGLLDGEVKGNRWDPVKSAENFHRACLYGDVEGCAEILGAYERDANALRTADRDALRAGCRLGVARACSYAAFVDYKPNVAKERSVREVKRSFQRGCELGDGWGCAGLGVVLEAERETPKALQAYQRACSLGEKQGCDAAKFTGKWTLLAPSAQDSRIGLGVNFSRLNNKIFVDGVMPGSPVSRGAALALNDEVLAVNPEEKGWTPTANLTPEAVAALVRGDTRAPVGFRVRRGGEELTLVFTRGRYAVLDNARDANRKPSSEPTGGAPLALHGFLVLETYFSGEGVGNRDINCLPGQHLTVLILVSPALSSLAQPRDQEFSSDVCHRTDFKKIAVQPSREQPGFVLPQVRAKSGQIPLSFDDAIDHLSGFGDDVDPAGNCPAGTKKVKLWVAKVPALPSELGGSNFPRGRKVYALAVSKPDSVRVLRASPKSACDDTGSCALVEYGAAELLSDFEFEDGGTSVCLPSVG